MLLEIFLVSGPVIETMMHWKTLTAFGDARLVICYCLNFQQEMKRDEDPRPNLIAPKDIEGKHMYIHSNYDTEIFFCILSEKDPFVGFAEASILMNCKIQTICVKANIS